MSHQPGMQLFDVQVPQGVHPGQTFKVNVGGQLMQVQCPANAHPGGKIRIQVPTQPVAAAIQPPMGLPVTSHVPPPMSTGKMDPNFIFDDADKQRKGYLSISDLQTILAKSGLPNFQMKTCRLMMSMFDPQRTGQINRTGFSGLWSFLDEWKALFDKQDTKRDGKMSRVELQNAVETLGYRFSPEFMTTLFRTYDEDNSGSITFDEFIQLFSELQTLTEAFKVHDTNLNGQATFSYEAFLKAAYSIHT